MSGRNPAPAAPHRPRLIRGLTADSRPGIGPGAAVQLLDAEWDVPGAWLVTGLSIGGSGATPVVWTLNTGVDRGQFVRLQEAPTNGQFSKIVLARSISLTAQVPTGAPPNEVLQAIVVPVDITADAAIISSLQGLFGGFGGIGVVPAAPHETATVAGIPVSIVSVTLSADSSSGVSVFNSSPAGRNLYLLAATSGPASIASGGYTIKLPPDGYWESPFGYSGPVFGIWDGADAAGFANVTSYA